MNFDVRCECGAYVVVSEGAAGARVDCDCGRTVTVPSLDELRKQAGLPPPAPNPVLVIEDMLAHGELPTAPACFHCDCAASDTILVTAECEKATGSEPNLILWVLAWWFLGIFAVFLREGKATELGRNLYLHLPVRLCRPCQRKFTSRRFAFGLGLIAVAAALTGIILVATGLVWGWGMLVISVLVFWIAVVAKKRRREALKNLLARERIYHQLLQHYPVARLVIVAPQR
jgi:hypothetical protein